MPEESGTLFTALGVVMVWAGRQGLLPANSGRATTGCKVQQNALECLLTSREPNAHVCLDNSVLYATQFVVGHRS
jgi:hypothetical protein